MNDLPSFPDILFFCLYYHDVWTSLPRVVYVIIVLVTYLLNGTISHRQWSGVWGNFLYPGRDCSSINSIYLSIFQNIPTWEVTFSETSWVNCNYRPSRRSCWYPHVLWLCIFLYPPLICLLQTFYSRCFSGFISPLSWAKNVSHCHNCIILPIWRVVNDKCVHLDFLEQPNQSHVGKCTV